MGVEVLGSVIVKKLGDICISTLLQWLNHSSLRQLEASCPTWKEIVKTQNLWQRLYEVKMKSIEWRKMEEILKERDVSFPSVGKPNFHCLASRMVGDALIDLKSNWTRQSFGSFHFSLNDCPKKPLPEENGLFTIHKQLIVRTNREGCIVTRSRFKSDDDEHVAEMLPEAKTPLNGEAPPKYGLVLCEGDKLVTVGQLETRKVLFVFDINQKANSFLLKLSWWQVIENAESEENLFKFDLNNCFRLNEGLIAICGSRISDKAAVVTVLNLQNKQLIMKNEEVNSRYGSVQDFAVDSHYVVLFIGSCEKTRLRKQLNRYRIQFRDVNTFALLRSFVLPIVNAPTCHFQYTKGIAVTGSDDSPIRIWNAGTGTCDGSFAHGYSKLSALQVVADRLILTCDENGVIQVWNFCAAILPDTRNDQNRILIATLKPPAFPYVSYRNVKVLAMRADEVQILLMLHCDKKEARVYVMDFLSESLNVKSSNARLSRKRRHSFQ